MSDRPIPIEPAEWQEIRQVVEDLRATIKRMRLRGRSDLLLDDLHDQAGLLWLVMATVEARARQL